MSTVLIRSQPFYHHMNIMASVSRTSTDQLHGKSIFMTRLHLSSIYHVKITRACYSSKPHYENRPSLHQYSSLVGNKRIRKLMDEMLRVNHSGEYGAFRIYAGQLAVLGYSCYAPMLKEMEDQERGHLATFDQMLYERRVRPSILTPLWHVAGYSLGYVTSLLGHESAMACTQAVEEVIAEHYNDQLRTIVTELPHDVELRETIRQFRDDEQEHHDTALIHDAKLAPGHALLYNGIKCGTKLAILTATGI